MDRASRSSSPRWKTRADGSLMIGACLRLSDRARPLLAAAGVDPGKFRAILETKLLLDQQGGPQGSENPMVSMMQALMISGYTLTGFMMGVVTLLVGRSSFEVSPSLWLGVCQLVTAGLLALPLIGHYGNLLLDPTDVGVIGPRPVPDATLFATRLAHVLLYMLPLAAALTLGPWLFGMFVYPWWAVAFVYPLATLLNTVMVVSGVGLAYATVLRVVGPARFQRVSLALQVLVMAAMMGGPQILIHVLPMREILAAIGRNPWLLMLVPPMHFGGLLEVLVGPWTPATWWLCAGSFAIPALTGLLTLRLARRHFQAALAGELVAGKTRHGWQREPLAGLMRWCGSGRHARAGFGITAALSRRDKMFVRAAWPSMLGMGGMFLVIPLTQLRMLTEPYRHWLLLALFFLPLVTVTPIGILRISENGKAGWAYDLLEPEQHVRVVSGGLRAVMFSMALPMLIVASLALGAVAGWRWIPETALAVLMVLWISLAGIGRMTHGLPFSMTVTSGAGMDGFTNVVTVFWLMIVAVCLAGVFAGLHLHPLGTIAGLVFFAVQVRRAWRRLDHPTLDPFRPE